MKIKTQKKADTGVSLSPGEMESFLEDMRARGRVEDTLDWYRRGLRKLYLFLPEEKRIRRGTLAGWRGALLAEGYASSTVNLFLSGANSYLEYLGFREFQLTGQLKKERKLQPELTRNEYLHLLRTAKALERERTYLLVKIFASTGLSVQEIGCVSVESVRQSRILLPDGRAVHLAPCFCGELLEYAAREGIRSGPIFLDRGGKPMSRTNVTGSIKQLCLAAGIPEEKGNPRCLRKLYLATKANVEANISVLVEQAMDRILEREQQDVGWETPGPENERRRRA